jgi:RND family efflux transporter MFP subunit
MIKMKKKIFCIIPSALLLLTMISCTNSNGNKKMQPPLVAVNTVVVAEQSVSFYDSYPGTITALKEVGLRGQVTGYITGIFFAEGGIVKKGQTLYEIDRRQYQAAYQQASDNVKIAQDNLGKVQRDADRYSVLNKQEAISKQLYDNTMTDLANAKSQVSVASQELVKAKTNLEYSLITAPFDGTIGISQVKIGDLITPGQTLLNTVSSDDPMGVDFVIDQAELGRFRQLETMNVTANDSMFRIILPGNIHYPSTGKIELIDRAVDPQTGTIRVRLIFPNQDYDLRPGMNCEIRVLHKASVPQLVIPYKAVVEQMGEYFVFVVDQEVAHQAKITLGQKVGSNVVIQDGLKTGEVIVTDGLGKLTDGTHIATEKPSSSGKYFSKY